MLWNQMKQEGAAIGWDFYGPVILFVILIALGVPVWAVIGAGAVTMLIVSGVLPLSLLGESLFDGIDHFALTAVPLFILTGDVLVRTGLSRKFLDVAEALTCWAKGGFGSATVLVCGVFSAISGSDAAGAAAVGRRTIARLVEAGYPRPHACAGRRRRLYRHSDSALDRVHRDRVGPRDFGFDPVPGGADSGDFDPGIDPCHQHRCQSPSCLRGREPHHCSRMGRQPLAGAEERLVRVPGSRSHLLGHLFRAANADRSRRHSGRHYDFPGVHPGHAETF